MTSTLEQKISELVDGELDVSGREQLYKQLKNTEEHQQTWARYCLISDALKSNLPANPKHNLANRLKSALESEPVYFAPAKPSSSKSDFNANDGVAVPAAAFAGGRERPAFRFGFGMAAAASVAVVSVVGMLVMGESNNEQTLANSMQSANVQGFVNTQPITSPVQFVAAPITGVLPHPGNSLVPNGQWERLSPGNNNDLEKFLIEHSETSSQTFSPNMFPYARVVGFEAGVNGSK